MDVKKLALLVGALVVAVITAVMAKNMFAGAGAQQAAAAPVVPLGPKVLVAKKALPVGTIVDTDSFTFQPWPKELMQSAYYVESQPDGDPKKLLGTVVRYPITAGQPVTRGCPRRPARPRLPRRCARRRNARHHGSREYAAGVAGFVFPGDHVDMVLTQTVMAVAKVPRSRSEKRSSAICASSRPISGSTARTRTARRRSRPSPTSRSKSRPRSPRRSRLLRAWARCRCRCVRSRTIGAELERAVASGDVKVPVAPAPTRKSRYLTAMVESSDRRQHDLLDRRRRVALPAPHRPGRRRQELLAKAMGGCGKGIGQAISGNVPASPRPQSAEMMSPCSGGAR